MPPRKSWTEKLNDAKGLPKVGKAGGKMSLRFAQGTMVIPAPIEVDEAMRSVKKGSVITINEIRELIAQKHSVDFACPMTTGIFAWIAAHAAAEQEAAGKKRVTPWWRTVKNGGRLNSKYPGGVEEQRRRLEAEGRRVVAKGPHLIVKTD